MRLPSRVLAFLERLVSLPLPFFGNLLPLQVLHDKFMKNIRLTLYLSRGFSFLSP